MPEAPAIVQDGVHCDPPSGIHVLIVGAGVGGLTAALECHRKGHSVRVIERASSATAAGDQFTIGLSGRRWIAHYPSMKAELDSISIQNRMQYFQWNGEAIGEPFAMKAIGLPPHVMEMMKDGPPMSMQMRPLFHQMLHHQLERFGIDVVYDQKVVLYWESEEKGKGCVMTDQGERVEADVVLAADGLHSRSKDVVLGGQGSGKPSGQSLFRCAVPFEKVMEDPVVKEQLGLDGGKPMMRAFIGPGTHCMALTYVDQEGENGTIAWGLNYYEPGEQSTRESWRNTVSSEEVIKIMDTTNPGWSPAIKALVRATPSDHIIHWPLLWRNPNPCWHSKHARVLQIGDAAHSFIPTSGNGATQAIEDAITIAEVLKQHHSASSVPLAVRTHNLLRYDRVSCAQLLGFVNQQRYHDTDFEVLKSDVTKVSAKVPKWIWTHDPEKYAVQRGGEASASLSSGEDGKGGVVFENSNFPKGHEMREWTLEGLEDARSEGRGAETLLQGDWS